MASVTTPNGFELDDSGKRVVVDPICRIEGHLRMEAEIKALMAKAGIPESAYNKSGKKGYD